MRTKYGEMWIIQSECGKIRTRKAPDTDTFHAVGDVEQKTFECCYVLPLSTETITLRKQIPIKKPYGVLMITVGIEMQHWKKWVNPTT